MVAQTFFLNTENPTPDLLMGRGVGGWVWAKATEDMPPPWPLFHVPHFWPTGVLATGSHLKNVGLPKPSCLYPWMCLLPLSSGLRGHCDPRACTSLGGELSLSGVKEFGGVPGRSSMTPSGDCLPKDQRTGIFNRKFHVF